jgi:hypothetical protein
MISIGGMIFGVGYAMDNQKLKNFGRDELIQSFINGAIVGSLFLFFSPGGLGIGVINGLVLSSNATATCEGYMSSNYAICFAYNYLAGITPVEINNKSYPSLLDSSLELLLPVSGLYITLGLISSTQLDLGIASISFSTILAPVLSQQDFIITALTFAIIGIYTQSALLGVISIVAVPFLLPVGLVLRTFYLTRRLGGTMVAIAIGLFAVFPLTYLFDAQITANYSGAVNQTTVGSLTVQAQSIQSGIFSVSGSSVSANSISGTAQHLASGVSALASSFADLIKQVIGWLAILIVQVFFFPVLSTVLTITSIRELSKILGSEVSFGKFDVF